MILFMSLLPIIATAAQGALGLINRQLDKDTSIDMLRRQTSIANAQADLANERQWEFVHYQDPDAVMRRYMDAGLNPNLIYKQLDGGVPTAPMASTPAADTPHSNLSFDLMDNILKEAQSARLDSASENETAITEKQVASIMAQTNLTGEQANMVVNQSKLFSQQIGYVLEQTSLLSEQKKGQLLDNLYKEDSYKTRLGILESDWKITSSQARNVDEYWSSVILGNKRQAQYYLSSANLNYAQESVAQSLGRLYDAEASYYRNESMATLQGNKLRQYKLDAAARHGGHLNPLGLRAATADLKLSISSSQYQSTVTDLLNRFGSSEHIFNLIESGTRSILNLSETISNLTPKKIFQMNSGPGGVTRSGTSSGPFASPLGSVKP